MHPSLSQTRNELIKFGLNPTEWLVQKISLQKEGTFVLFESLKEKGMKLKGQLERSTKHTHLVSLELISL